MIKRTLYFGSPAYLSFKDMQMVVDRSARGNIQGGDPGEGLASGQTLARIPIEDIGVVLLDNPQITVSHPLLNALLANNTAVITCNERHIPSGLLLPLEGNTLQAERYAYQIAASVPLRKQLWQQTIQTKIANQAAVLEKLGLDSEPMHYFKQSVRSGDPDNYEGRAAAHYWKHIFNGVLEGDFTRGRFEDDPNNLLNYGYAVLRAVIARSLVATGLLPTLGIHHHNRYNAFCLADDVMEPYRPYVDVVVHGILNEHDDVSTLTPELKAKLLVIPAMDVTIDGKSSPLMIAAGRTTASLNDCFEGGSRRILYPMLKG